MPNEELKKTHRSHSGVEVPLLGEKYNTSEQIRHVRHKAGFTPNAIPVFIFI